MMTKAWGLGLILACSWLMVPLSGKAQSTGDDHSAGPARAEPPGVALPRAVPSGRAVMAALQAALDRQGFGVGLIDGRGGVKTQQALADFRQANGGLDAAEARARLLDLPGPAFVAYTVTSNDLALIGSAPADWEEAAVQPAMACESILEGLSEKFHVSERLLPVLNPEVADWNALPVGTVLRVPSVRDEKAVLPKAAWIHIDTGQFRVRAYGAVSNLLVSFPCSIARDRAKVPVGELAVATVAPNPNYTFDPANFPESPRAQAIGHRLILPPGPNNPVGVFWVSLNQPGYGMHGTPKPATIGNMESHGCFRLCNWDARTLGGMITVGIPVRIDAP
jgi:lipoprotein-anchoring transpeptidase ErfK/SrfK